jgi:hypothetical protein
VAGSLVTPVYARIGRKLVDSMRNPTLVCDPAALTVFSIKPKGLREAIGRALRQEDQEFALTRWSDALSSGGKPASWGGARLGTRLVDSRTAQVSVPPSSAFAPIQRIGGSNGWYFANFLWRLRGFLDLLVGGVGLPFSGRNHRRLARKSRPLPKSLTPEKDFLFAEGGTRGDREMAGGP